MIAGRGIPAVPSVLGRRAALAAICAGLVAHALVFDFVCDDAFIAFRYADNLVRHGQLVYNPGERVEGYSSFLWTALMAAVIALRQDVVLWSKLLGLACGVLVLLVLARFESRRRGRASMWDALAPFLLGSAPAFACWCMGGLETQLFTLLFTMAWTRYVSEQEVHLAPSGIGGDATGTAPRPWSGVWFALATMARPEGLLLFAATVLHRFVPWPRAGADPAAPARASKLQRLRREARWLLAFAVPFAPWFTWRWAYYGWPLPNTYYAKVSGVTMWGAGWRYVASWIVQHPLLGLASLATLALGFRMRGSERRLVALVALHTGVLALVVLRAGGDFMALHRFLVPILPGLAAAAALGLRAVLAPFLVAGRRVPATAAAAVVALVAGLHTARVDRRALVVERTDGIDSIGLLRLFATQWSTLGQWLASNAPPQTSIAITAAGAIPYYSRLYTLDALGLNDAWVAHHAPARAGDVGHVKLAPARYILSKEIGYLVFHPVLTATPPRPLAEDDAFWSARGYHWRTQRIPGLDPPWWGFWERER